MKNSFLSAFLIACLCCIININAQWNQANGPCGGTVFCLAVNGDWLYAGTESSGVFLSDNNGSAWKAANTGFPNIPVNCITAAGSNIFAGTSRGIFRSTDSGENWKAVNTGLKDTMVVSFAAVGKNIYAGTNHGGIYLSTDKGNTWNLSSSGFHNAMVMSLFVNGSNLFAGTFGGGVYRSTDYGENWKAVNTGMTSNSVNSFIASGSNLFIGTYGGVFLSTNSGESWKAVNNGLPVIDTLLGRTVNSLAVSHDEAGSTYLFAALGNNLGVFVSTDNGSSWQKSSSGLSQYFDFNSLIAKDNGAGGSNIFASARYGGVFISTDYGKSWNEANNGLIISYVSSISATQTGFFAGGTFSFYFSSDNGSNWSDANDSLLFLNGISSIADFTDSAGIKNIFAAAGGFGIFHSVDNGRNWKEVKDGITADFVYSIIYTGTNLFAGTDNGVFASNDYGKNWKAANNGLNNIRITDLLSVGDNLFAGSADNGIYLSTDNGANWETANTGLTDFEVCSLAASNNNIFAACYNPYKYVSDIFLSTDNGTTWQVIDEGLPSGINYYYHSPKYLSLAAIPNEEGSSTIFTGTCRFGVYMSTNNGTTWTPISNGLPEIPIYSIAVFDSNIFAGTNGCGIFKLPLSEIITSVKKTEPSRHENYYLAQNYPNPFNPVTTISYRLPVRSKAELKIIDILGREAAVLVNEEKSAGTYTVAFDGSNLPSGVYFYRLQAGNFSVTKKLMLVK
jgi:photosystem II stability/assembly factor-like uncharacterized protein